MPTYIYIIDKHYNLLTELGILNMRDIIELNKEAEKYNLDILTFLDFVGENIFGAVLDDNQTISLIQPI